MSAINESMIAAVEARDIHKNFEGVEVLHGVDLSVARGVLTLITGPSGSGKTTMLNILGGIEDPDRGQVMHGDVCITDMNETELTAHRGQKTGFVFQHASLIGNLTAAENIVYSRGMAGGNFDKKWATQISSELGILPLLGIKASKLSGGEKQRVAFVRALVHKPDIIFADEPSASLDSAGKEVVHDIMRGVTDNYGTTVVFVSHDSMSRNYADEVVELLDGKIAA